MANTPAMNKLNKLLAIRTRLLEDVAHHILEIDTFTDQTKRTVISYRTTALEKAYKDLIDTNEMLEDLTQYHALENITDIKQANRAIQDKYLHAKFQISELVDNDADRTLNSSFFQARREVRSNTDETSNQTGSLKTDGLHFKKIDIPIFKGKYEEWPEYKNMFLALMKKFRGDDFERLAHLKNSLEGEAKGIVKHLNNYTIAWDLLVAQYENKNAIFEAYMLAINDLPFIANAPTIREAITTMNNSLAGIKDLDIMIDTWDPIIILTLRNKLSPELRQKWEEERKGSYELPTLKEFLIFLETRCKIYASIPKRQPQRPIFNDQKSRPQKAFVTTNGPQANSTALDESTLENETIETIQTSAYEDATDNSGMFHVRAEKCLVCDGEHRTFTCSKMKTPADALRLAKEKKLCLNCLYNSHDTAQCISRFSCNHCQKRHHTILHEAFTSMDLSQKSERMLHTQTKPRGTILATAIVPIYTPYGIVSLRALIDQGSTSNLISERGAQLIRCNRQKITSIPMIGLDNVVTSTANFKTAFVIGSLYDDVYRLAIPAYITRNITAIQPIASETLNHWPHLQNLQLADPMTDTDQVDLLIGTRTYSEIIEVGLIKGEQNQPIAQKTSLGWIISGGYDISESLFFNQTSDDEPIHINMINNETLSAQLKTFWEIEGVSENKKEWTSDEHECFKYFMKNVTRANDGKLLMRIPFKEHPNSSNFLGDSLKHAEKRFAHLERRFERNPNLKKEYTKCINEYISLGHAVKVPMSKYCHVIPHHAVFKETSLTTKLRAVFDASAKTTNGYSLNDRMHVGPKILEELWAVLMRWRLGEYALSSDIEKMYRQFWVHPDDARFQQILWRNDQTGELELYELHTVTFGTAAAPFMAIQGVLIIADTIEKDDPELAEIIRKSFYVDDCLKSVDTIEEAITLKGKLTRAFAEYGLNLRKWNSNARELSSDEMVDVKTHPEGHCTALGMQWNTASDELSYKLTLKKDVPKITKRTILSDIASLFDPLGLLAPIIMRAKIFMQSLWLGTFGWDDEIPSELIQEWRAIKSMLMIGTNIKIPRWVGFKKLNKQVSLHGFSDASIKIYAAAVYLRTEYEDGTIEIHLLTSKTKSAPLKQISIPRLELCAAVLLAQLLTKVKGALSLPECSIHAWTDSAVTLAWIATPSHKLKPFVANRVSMIQELIAAENWRYVKSTDNPADCATRCEYAGELVSLTRWWNGPTFLQQSSEQWPKTPPNMLKRLPELKTKAETMMHIEADTPNDLLNRYSSFNKLLRITAVLLRWRKPYAHFRKNIVVTPEELDHAKKTWIRYVQGRTYDAEIKGIQEKQPIHSRSPILSLTPFLTNDGILRVRGRLRNATLPTNIKHPAILPANNSFTTLIIRQAHFRALHGGLQLTLRTIRDEYWIVRAKPTIAGILRKCVTCFRDRCQPMQQQMADLRAPQVQANRPFTHTGVDFAGYFEVKTSTKRNAAYTKCYISLFICLTTKAVHLELAPDLSTQAFIAVLNRFIARRGIPSDIYSDRGTNFVGTSKELPRLWYEENSQESKLIQRECSQQGITWHFNPARASHFGGLWEAGVKSVKTHLHRAFKETKLTYEEFNTIITQIEACLNSRPLCAISDDPGDYEALTPGHFLIGHALNTMPHPDVEHIPMTRRSRYQYLQGLIRSFWECWLHDYITSLQQRPKWKQQHPNLQPGQLVIIQEDNMPPSKWLLGRIIQTHPGRDGLTRCADVKCKESTVSRPIHKLCLLPIDDNTNEQSTKG